MSAVSSYYSTFIHDIASLCLSKIIMPIRQILWIIQNSVVLDNAFLMPCMTVADPAILFGLCLVTGDSFDPSGVSMWVVAGGGSGGSMLPDVRLGLSLCDATQCLISHDSADFVERLSLSPGNSLVSSWCDHSMLASLLYRCLTVPSLLQLC